MIAIIFGKFPLCKPMNRYTECCIVVCIRVAWSTTYHGACRGQPLQPLERWSWSTTACGPVLGAAPPSETLGETKASSRMLPRSATAAPLQSLQTCRHAARQLVICMFTHTHQIAMRRGCQPRPMAPGGTLAGIQGLPVAAARIHALCRLRADVEQQREDVRAYAAGCRFVRVPSALQLL